MSDGYCEVCKRMYQLNGNHAHPLGPPPGVTAKIEIVHSNDDVPSSKVIDLMATLKAALEKQ